MRETKVYVFELNTEKLEHIEIKATSMLEAEQKFSSGEFEEEDVILKDETFLDWRCIRKEKLKEENEVWKFI